MNSEETQSNKFEIPEIWEKIEICGFDGDKNKIDQVKYYLTLALNGNDSNIEVENNKIIIKYFSDIDKNNSLFKITLNKMLEKFEKLEAIAY